MIGKWILSALLLAFSVSLHAQNSKGARNPDGVQGNDFCSTLQAIVACAVSNFTDIRGRELADMDKDSRYVSLKGVAGAITSNIVNDSLWRFEAVFYQGSSKEKAESCQQKYMSLLNECLPSKGFSRIDTENTPARPDAKQVISFNAAGRATVYLETDHSPGSYIYTTTLFVSR